MKYNVEQSVTTPADLKSDAYNSLYVVLDSSAQAPQPIFLSTLFFLPSLS